MMSPPPPPRSSSSKKKSNVVSKMYSNSPYQAAANLVNELLERRVSLKTLVYDKKTGDLKCSTKAYALASKVHANLSVLKDVLEAVEKDNKQEHLRKKVENKGLLYVLLYELLLGPKQNIKGGGAVKRQIVKQETELRKALESVQPAAANEQVDNEQASTAEDKPVSFPRYLRVNTLLATTAEIKKIIKEELQVAVSVDPDVPDLLIVPNSATSAIQSHAFLSKRLVLQDKSSCFPAYCLVHGFDDDDDDDEGRSSSSKATDYLDACAAPGNKTSHLASLLQTQKGNETSILLYALDQDKSRYELLQKRIKELVPRRKNIKVQVKNCDFLKTTAKDYPNVGAILLDPTCSGSGIVGSTPQILISDHNKKKKRMKKDKGGDDNRVEALAKFQLTALKHAMTAFPKVSKIVYSTCSVNVQENEQVVARALYEYDEQQNNKKEEWQVVPPTCLKQWKRRGVLLLPPSVDECEWTSEQAQAVIRVDPRFDKTNGFFVCCLQRRQRKKGRKRSDSTTSSQTSASRSDSGSNKKKKRKASDDDKLGKETGSTAAEPQVKKDTPAPAKQQKKGRKGKVEETKNKTAKTGSGESKTINTGQPSSSPDRPGGDIHKRKRQKRLAWKQKQLQAKRMRLKEEKKKKAAPEVATVDASDEKKQGPKVPPRAS